MQTGRPLADTNGRHQSAEMVHSSGSTSETEVLDEEWESLVKDTTADWLAIHGAKLFALEASKFLAQEARKKDLRSKR